MRKKTETPEVFLTRRDVGTLFGHRDRTIELWILNHGLPVHHTAESGKQFFVKEDVLNWYSEYEKTKAHRVTATHSFDEAKTRKMVADAMLAELELARETKKVVEVDAVVDIVKHQYANVRAKLLAIPTRVAPQIYLMDNITDVQTMLEQVINETLEELQEDAMV